MLKVALSFLSWLTMDTNSIFKFIIFEINLVPTSEQLLQQSSPIVLISKTSLSAKSFISDNDLLEQAASPKFYGIVPDTSTGPWV